MTAVRQWRISLVEKQKSLSMFCNLACRKSEVAKQVAGALKLCRVDLDEIKSLHRCGFSQRVLDKERLPGTGLRCDEHIERSWGGTIKVVLNRTGKVVFYSREVVVAAIPDEKITEETVIFEVDFGGVANRLIQ